MVACFNWGLACWLLYWHYFVIKYQIGWWWYSQQKHIILLNINPTSRVQLSVRLFVPPSAHPFICPHFWHMCTMHPCQMYGGVGHMAWAPKRHENRKPTDFTTKQSKFHFFTSVMWRNKKFLHNCQDFRILHICHVKKSEIPLHVSDFSTFAMYGNLKFLHMTDFSPHVSHVDFVTNMRYGYT